MNITNFTKYIEQIGSDFYTGVPDSQLAPLCDYLINTHGISERHIIGANEGNCVAIAAGYHLSTGKIPTVYLQNSGIGNIVNPVASLLNEKVYGIPCIFVVGWRGEPGVKDEPQHLFQGEITLELLKAMGLFTIVLDKNTNETDLKRVIPELSQLTKKGKSIVFLVKKDALSYDEKIIYKNQHILKREDIIASIVNAADEDIIVSTTGKASRELFEIRERNDQSHQFDFLTVGSMGYSSSIALGIAINKKNTKVWCIDGDGAVLMHMGAMALIGSNAPENLIHIVINNGSHETVGGMPTVSNDIDLVKIAKGCGYPFAISVSTSEELEIILNDAKKSEQLMFIEVKSSIGSRKNLGRPTKTPIENKESFVNFLKEVKE